MKVVIEISHTEIRDLLVEMIRDQLPENTCFEIQIVDDR